MASDFVYLYGFVPADASSPDNLTGLGGGNVSLLPVGNIKAVVSRASADEYNPARIESSLQDLAWVAQQGVAHESVVAWFVDHAEILPVPLFTMYSSETALRDSAGATSLDYEAELRRLHDKREWDVKISFDEREVQKHAGEISPRIAELEREAAAATPGKRYLLEKKRDDLLKTETRDAAQRIAREVIDDVAQKTVEHRSLPIPRTADDLPVVQYTALLVERSAEAELIELLEREAERLKGLGLGLTFSGPWAAYRFTRQHER
ncbi:MAG TPA: GvpL/GvpF family gas vesicle protein [Longimicrobiales bacterium]|nr:GvpL/GvpF family gas vesicle protein [Longimicrobiales bacterium]